MLLLAVSYLTQAQQVQWAQKVLSYSSDLGGKQNSIKRILGRPDAFPQGGPSANAWVAKDALGTAYVEVAFEKAQSVKQIAVFENLNSGCVTRIMVGDGNGKYHTISRKKKDETSLSYGRSQKSNADRQFYYNRKRRKIEKAPDVSFNADIEYFILENAEENVKALKIEFNFALKPGQKQVDAIGISDSETLITPEINLMPQILNLNAGERFLVVEHAVLDFNAPFIIGDEFFYTIGADKASEIHALNLQNPTVSIDVTKRIRNDRKHNYILGYAPATQLLLMGSEDKYRIGNQTAGYDFFSYENGTYAYQSPLKVTAYTNYGDYADAFMTQDAQHIIFAVESDLTVGGFDLYFTQPKHDGNHTLLQNMGRNLNTAADETTPFVLSDNRTMIFASNGYSGYGDFDLYVSTRLDDTWKNWSEPKNLGPKVNGQSFDTSPVYDEKTEMLYYISLRDGLSTIQRIKIPAKLLTGEN